MSTEEEKKYSPSQEDLDAVEGKKLSTDELEAVEEKQLSADELNAITGGARNLYPKIPGPSWVNQQSFRPEPASSESKEEESISVSAVEVFQALFSQ